MEKLVNLENELLNEVLKNTKRQLSPDEMLYAMGCVAEVQRKLDITEAIERERERRGY